MIPRIIHQTWKTHEVPERWLAWQRSWRESHPAYEYRYWTDADNREFMAGHYPEFLPIYDGYKLGVHRADMVRYFIVRHFGGVYVDMDFEALKPLDSFLDGKRLIFGLEPQTHARRPPVLQRGLSRIVCNAFIASEPGHPFWDFFLPRLAAAKDEEDVLDATGPFVLTRACDAYVRPEDISVVSADILYPIDNEQVRSLNDAQVESRLQHALAVHHWQGTWMRDAVLMEARNRIARSRKQNVS
jgi:mannosyltransferase OCH1-like enzyme